jgi:hypothetical protein
VWIKANGTRIKVNAVLDDASNETFLNEEAAGFLELSGKWQDVQVHVLNDAVETLKSIPLQVEIESTDRQFSKEINVITCPHAVTANYRVVDWNQYQKDWPHLRYGICPPGCMLKKALLKFTQMASLSPPTPPSVDLYLGAFNIYYMKYTLLKCNGQRVVVFLSASILNFV